MNYLDTATFSGGQRLRAQKKHVSLAPLQGTTPRITQPRLLFSPELIDLAWEDIKIQGDSCLPACGWHHSHLGGLWLWGGTRNPELHWSSGSRGLPSASIARIAQLLLLPLGALVRLRSTPLNARRFKGHPTVSFCGL